MNILCIGDIVGRPGRTALSQILPQLKEEFKYDFVIVNGENAAGGFGITSTIADEIFQLGCNTITLGDHVWDKREISDYLINRSDIIRPANFPEGAPGSGWTVQKSKSGAKIGIINLLGRVFMRYNVDCPFRKLEQIVSQVSKETKYIFVDFHAEATSEKTAIGNFIDGKVTAVFGTHTHIQTADERILPKGTAYITDLGMTGPYDSVIGQNKEIIVQRFLSSLPSKLEVAQEDIRLCGAVVELDEATGLAKRITRVQKKVVL